MSSITVSGNKPHPPPGNKVEQLKKRIERLSRQAKRQINETNTAKQT